MQRPKNEKVKGTTRSLSFRYVRAVSIVVCVCVCKNDILFFLSLVVNGVDDCDKMCGVLCVCCIFVLVCSKAVSQRNHATEFVFARQK